jgi:hypothetical protein
MQEEETRNYHIGNGTKLGYASTSTGTRTYINGVTNIPAVGGTPDEVDTDSLDNLKYHTTINGLMPAVKLEINMNMEDPDANSNIKKVYDLAESGNIYYWFIEYSNGVTVSFRSDVRYSIDETTSGELIKFTMYLSAIGEPTTSLPASI